ncbi:MAG TPA: hypothetical protein VH437_18295 [Terriglobales bacterium]
MNHVSEASSGWVREQSIYRRNRAIVVGGSLAGLLTARVLSDHFAEVRLLEKDPLSDDVRPRPGVPQSQHLHALLPRGLNIIESLFPGICEELRSYGAIPLDIGDDVAWLTPQGWGVKFRSELEALSFTRDLLDFIVRRRVIALKNVALSHRWEVGGLVRSASGSILGVRARELNADPRAPYLQVPGDLVVIATGRLNAISKWFDDAGIEQPMLTTVNAHIGYASRMYRRPSHHPSDWQAVILQAAPPATHRSGLVFPVEGDRWLVTLIGADRDYPPNDDTGFLEFARSLANPCLYQAIRDAEPLTPIRAYRATDNRQLHLDQIRDWPDGLIVLGDAACAFNPVYGQGMSTAAIEASLLSTLLGTSSPLGNPFRGFQRRIAQVIKSPWTLATSADLRFRSVEGAHANWRTRIMHWYVDRVLRLGTTDRWSRKRFLEVQGMLRDTSAILKPDMAWRVLLSLGQSSNGSARHSPATSYLANGVDVPSH